MVVDGSHFRYVLQGKADSKTLALLNGGMHAFFEKLGIAKPIFIGASDGGMVSQIYTQKYHG